MSTETLETPKVNLSDLTPAQKKQLAMEALAEEKSAKSKIQEQREAYKALVAETVPKALFKLAVASEFLSKAKKETFEYFETALQMKNEVYGIKERQRSHTFSCDGGEITIGFRVTDGWDDTVHVGVEKVRKFISSLSNNDETATLVEMVFDLLKKDDKGNLKSNRVLELQKMKEKFNNDDFSDGVEIISKAFKPKRSSWFIEAYHINSENGEKTNIPLNISSVDFAEGYKFDFLKPETNVNDIDVVQSKDEN